MEISSGGFTTHNVIDEEGVENQILKHLIIQEFPHSSLFLVPSALPRPLAPFCLTGQEVKL